MNGDREVRRKLAQIAWASALFLGFLYTVHWSLVSGLRNLKTNDFGVWNRVLSGEVNAEVLVTGASRALVHFDCQTIADSVGLSCFNIGLDGAPIAQQFPMLEAYLESNRPPRLIVQSLGHWNLLRPNGIYRPTLFVAYHDVPAIYDGLIRLDPNYWKYRYLPLYAFSEMGPSETNLAIRGLLGMTPPFEETRFQGFRPMDSTWDFTFEAFQKDNPHGKYYEIDPEAVQRFIDVGHLARARGIYIVYVLSPELEELHPLIRNRAELMSTYRTIAREVNAPFLDYSEHPVAKSRRYFYNSQHLNRTGAAVFSERFAEDLKTLLSHSQLAYADTAP